MKNAVFTSKIHTRFKDIDCFGHVNNAVYLTYFEECRKAFFVKEFSSKNGIKFSFILASVRCEYIKPLKLTDCPMTKMSVSKIGVKSFVFKYIICDINDGEIIFAKGYSTQVFFDYNLNKSESIDMVHKKVFLKYYENGD